MKQLGKRTLAIAILALFSIVQFAPPIYAQATTGLSPGQQHLFDNDIQYLNYDYNTGCGTTTTGTPANLTVDKGFSLGTGDERRVNLMKALIADYQLTPEQAAGIVGNFMWESGGINVPPDVNEGGKPGPPAFHGGYGWAQWTGSRQVSFIDFAVTNGYMASKTVNATDAADYAWLKQELASTYKTTIPEVKKTNNPDDAASRFEATYESAGVPAIANRQAFARQVLQEFNGGGTPGTGSTGTAGTPGGCASATNASCNDSASCAKLLLQMATDGKINLQAGGQHDLTPAAAGQQITSCPQGPVTLNTTLLQLLVKLANDLQAKSPNYKLNIHNFVSPPWHACDGLFHTKGRAADVHVDDMGGCHGSGSQCLATAADYHKPLNHDFAQDVMDSLPPGGGLGQKEYIGPLNNTAGKRYFDDANAHFHIDAGAQAP